MQWVEGQSLEKYVEANLHRPQMLLELASWLIQMVKDLENREIAHGDLQHGNILIRGTELKLVDYDGMFVPAFTGTHSPERGLPSYQHPRRDGSLYNAALDRFPLLVICTALCALAADPSLWDKFSTGDNLLFTKEDFEDPQRSVLFNRFQTLADTQAAHFAEMLKAACLKNPDDVPFPQRLITTTVTPKGRPWWIISPPPPPPTRPIEPRRDALSGIYIRLTTYWSFASGLIKAHWSFLSGLTFLVGLVKLYLANIAGGEVIAYLTISVAVFYIVERYNRFRNLPVFTRRKDLSTKIAQLTADLHRNVSEQSRLQNERARLSQREAQEKAQALKELQEKELATALSRIDISRLTEIRGIGSYVINNLRAAGIHNASQLREELRRHGTYRMRGIGPKRGKEIRHMLSNWEAVAKQQIPKMLPPDVEYRITSAYAQQWRTIVNQITAIEQKIATLRAEISRCEWDLKQLYVPSFSEFLKRNF
jgi:predicted flap endonuclease-1-like 5' DNA nuclease